MRSFSPISAAVLLVQPFLAAAETRVVTGTTLSCTWTDNALSNPSFDSGVLTPWAVYNGYGTASIVADASGDGGYVAAMVPSSSSYAVLYQTLTDLVAGDTYSLSFDYKIQSATRAGTCNFYFAIDGITAASRITTTVNGYIQYSTTETDWQTLSTTYVPTSSSLDMYIQVICSSGVRGIAAQPTIYVDNTQFSNPNKEIEICTDVPYASTITLLPTPTVTPTSTPVVTPSQAVTSSASVITAASSSVIASAISSPQPSASLQASSSIVVPSSIVSIPAASTPIIPSSQTVSTSQTPQLSAPSNPPTTSPAAPSSTLIHSSSAATPFSSTILSVPGSSSITRSVTPSPSAIASPSSVFEDVVTITTTVYTTELIVETNCPVLEY
ncbi:carbohydrate binding domain-containing protein [Aspergillus fijiensis CBS 313.89]|uniref:CBM-cenC domain-containing protein n=1 Tax=Aspergillus fijiensis CBS 313.89 TaxID=1448319 RepID=A0A8G1RW22_9EURO|nr:uncharacterized protein BO72DRAFT_446629 [Aspergillus fijiensis CBS 313.89]RAK78850.1 hypothetical protein BO72DRAFT_446629 [Aspergillus fijiensis CBS 313.89]